MQQAIIKRLLADAVKIVQGKKTAVIDNAARQGIESFKNAVITAADADKLPKNRQAGRIGQQALDFLVFSHAAIADEDD